MDKKTVRDVDLKGKRVLMRADFNVPLDGTTITDDTRIRAALPTIQYILDNGASLVLMSHLGRPKGATPALSLQPVADRLGELLSKPVKMAPDVIGDEVQAMFFCWKTPASTAKRRIMTLHSRPSWRPWVTSSSTTRSAPRTVRMPALWA